MTRFCSKTIYEQTGTKATEIHSHHCLYCDTTFPQFDDLIKHSRENHPYHCFKMYSRSANGGEKGDPNRNPWLAKEMGHVKIAGPGFVNDVTASTPPANTLRIHNVAVWLLFGQVPFLRENYVATT
jgi:hypothetical protein